MYEATTYYSTIATRSFGTITDARAWAESFGDVVAGVLIHDARGRLVAHHRRSVEGDGSTWYAAQVGLDPADHRPPPSSRQTAYLLDLLAQTREWPTVCAPYSDVRGPRMARALRSLIVDIVMDHIGTLSRDAISELIEVYRNRGASSVGWLYWRSAEILGLTEHASAERILDDVTLADEPRRVVPYEPPRDRPAPDRETATFRSRLIAYGARRGPLGKVVPGEERRVDVAAESGEPK
jgi:hypothetical protein